MDELLTTTQCADRLGCSPAYVRELLEAGRLQGNKLGPMWVVPAAAVDEFLRGRRRRGRPRERCARCRRKFISRRLWRADIQAPELCDDCFEATQHRSQATG